MVTYDATKFPSVVSKRYTTLALVFNFSVRNSVKTRAALNMSALTFESLSDELIMMIMEYSGVIHNVLRTYFGLNQRLNNIILDGRSHMLIRFTHLIVTDEDSNDISKSPLYQQLFENLSMMKTTRNGERLIEYLQVFLVKHLEEKYIELGNEFQSKMTRFIYNHNTSTWKNMTDLRYQLRQEFHELIHSPKLDLMNMKKITSLILTYGIDLEDDMFRIGRIFDAPSPFLSLVTGKQLILNKFPFLRRHFMNTYKALMICSIYHFAYQHQGANARNTLYRGFTNLIWQLKDIKSHRSSNSTQRIHSRVLIDIVLYFIQGLLHTFNQNDSSESDLFDLMKDICFQEWVVPHDPWLEIIMKQIVKIILDEYTKRIPVQLRTNSYVNYNFLHLIKTLSSSNRCDELLFFCQYNQHVKEQLNRDNIRRRLLRVLLATRQSRHFFNQFIDQKILDSWLTNQQWIFYLVKRKETRFLEKLLQVYPSLKHTLDQDGNDLLLYGCLKVTGRRYSMIEFLSELSCHQQRQNNQGLTWIDTLQLEHNRKLLQWLKTKSTINAECYKSLCDLSQTQDDTQTTTKQRTRWKYKRNKQTRDRRNTDNDTLRTTTQRTETKYKRHKQTANKR